MKGTNKMTNKEFAEKIKQLTKPEYSFQQMASLLNVTPQKLSYYTRIKSVLDPDGESPFRLNEFLK